MATRPTQAIEVFIVYAHGDEDLKNELLKRLANLERQGVITGWHDRQIIAGQEWAGEIDEHINSARIILLLVTPDFMASDYCYDIEVRRAMERHEAGEACVIPIILRPCDWEGAPFSKLQAVPTNAKAVTRWEDLDEAFLSVVKEIRRALQALPVTPPPPPPRDLGCRLPPQMLDSTGVDFVPRRDADDRDLLESVLERLAPRGKKKSVTLWGLGGVGKTRLAVEVACKWNEAHGGRIVWCDASQRVDYTLKSLLDDIINQLSDPYVFVPDLKQAYQRAHELVIRHTTLIVLDNYEEVAAKTQEHIKNWLRRADCVVLFVSRERVEHTDNIPVREMSPEEAEKFIDLLVKETQDPDKFSEKIRQRISQTAERTPLLMEWVVRQIDNAKTTTDRVFKDLERGKGSAVQRIFDHSFNLPQIGDDGRITLLAVSLFKPDASREALAEVAGFPGEMERLEEAIGNLRKFGLINATKNNSRLLISGSTLKMARSRLPGSKHAEDIWRRFLTYFKNQIRERPETLTTEKSNILGAIQVAPCIRDWDSVVELYDMTLVPLHSFRVWTKAIELSEQDAEERIRIDSKATPIIIKIDHQSKSKARTHYEGIRKQLNEDRRWKRVVLSAANFGLGVFAYEDGDFWLARDFFIKAEELKKSFGDFFGAALAANNLGVMLALDLKEDWAANAREKFKEAAKTFKASDPQHEESICAPAGSAAAAGNRTSRLAKWLVACFVRLLSALGIVKESGRSVKRGARFAKVVNQNLEWLERLERLRARE